MRRILNFVDATSELARWRVRFMEFDFEVIHIATDRHQAMNELSLLQIIVTDDKDIDGGISVLLIEQMIRVEKHQYRGNYQHYDDSTVNLVPQPIIKRKADDVK